MKAAALLLDGAPQLERASAAAGLEIVRVGTLAEGHAALARERFALVDGRLAQPRPLEEEVRSRLEAFFARLGAERTEALYDAVMREVERPLIASALARANGVRSAAAAALGIDRGTLGRRIRALGLDGGE